MSIHAYLKRAYSAYIRRLYAKSDFLFFLNTTHKVITRRVSAQVAATNVFRKGIRPIALVPPLDGPILILAPHQDDEAIGCGGTLLLHSKLGGIANVAFVQCGASEDILDPDVRQSIINTREEEARASLNIAQINEPIFLRHHKLDIDTLAETTASFVELIIRLKPNSIFSPFFLDPDRDHAITNLALALALRKTKHKCKVFGYEVWSICIANVAIAIDATLPLKIEMLNCYKSQLQSTDYTHSTVGLNMFHSRVFPEKNAKYVEHFFVLPSAEFIEAVVKVSKELWPDRVHLFE